METFILLKTSRRVLKPIFSQEAGVPAKPRLLIPTRSLHSHRQPPLPLPTHASKMMITGFHRFYCLFWHYRLLALLIFGPLTSFAVPVVIRSQTHPGVKVTFKEVSTLSPVKAINLAVYEAPPPNCLHIVLISKPSYIDTHLRDHPRGPLLCRLHHPPSHAGPGPPTLRIQPVLLVLRVPQKPPHRAPDPLAAGRAGPRQHRSSGVRPQRAMRRAR